MRWASAIGSIELHELSIPVVLNATDNSADIREIDPVVTREVLLLHVAGIRKAAIKAARHGEIAVARGLFNQAISALTAIGADLREIEELVDLANRLEQFTERDMKGQYSSMRSSSKGRIKRFD